MLLEGGRTAHSTLKLSLNIQINVIQLATFREILRWPKCFSKADYEFVMSAWWHKINFGRIRSHVARFSEEPKPLWWYNDFIGVWFSSKINNLKKIFSNNCSILIMAKHLLTHCLDTLHCLPIFVTLVNQRPNSSRRFSIILLIFTKIIFGWANELYWVRKSLMSTKWIFKFKIR